jgi:5'-nucleotidase
MAGYRSNNKEKNTIMERPLILVTNDDGITSKGLWAAVEAVLPLGEVLVVAPDCQWSGAGRSMPHYVTGRLMDATREVHGRRVTAYGIDASPALAVEHGVLELAPRAPSLVVSGINFGANLGSDVTISGTVGAALEAGHLGSRHWQFHWRWILRTASAVMIGGLHGGHRFHPAVCPASAHLRAAL